MDGKTSSDLEKYLNDNNKNDDSSWADEEKKGKNKKIISIFLIIVIAAVSVLAYLSLINGHKTFASENVGISINLPENFQSGSEISILFEYENDNSVVLQDSSVEIFFPEGFVFISSDVDMTEDENNYRHFTAYLGEIGADSTGKIRVYGKLSGELNEKKSFSSSMEYEPSNFKYDFRSENEFDMYISSVPADLEFELSEEVDGGAEKEFLFSYTNKSSRVFSKAKLNITFPEGFVISSSGYDKENDFDDTISFIKENLLSEEEVFVSVKGSAQGDGLIGYISAELYFWEDNVGYIKYGDKENGLVLKNPDISLKQKINGNDDYFAQKNEQLEYEITFKNETQEDIKGLVINTYLDGEFDLSTVEAEKGTVNGNEIIWSALKVPALADLSPGEEGSVYFKVKSKDYFDINDSDDKNFLLNARSEISIIDADGDTLKKIVSSDIKSTKIKALVSVSSKGYFNDDGRIENGGEIPPKVGKETLYTVHWNIKNLFNDTEKIFVYAVLPNNVEITGKYINSDGKILDNMKIVGEDENISVTEDNPIEDDSSIEGEGSGEIGDIYNETEYLEEDVYYDEKSRKIYWFIPRLKANDGILTSAKEIVFQVSLIPESEDIGSSPEILGAFEVSCFDVFVQEDIKFIGTNLTTHLVDDYSIGLQESIVSS